MKHSFYGVSKLVFIYTELLCEWNKFIYGQHFSYFTSSIILDLCFSLLSAVHPRIAFSKENILEAKKKASHEES